MGRYFFIVGAVALLIFISMAGCSKKKPASGPGETMEGTREGFRAPVFSLPDLDGKEVSLEDYAREKVILLSFWATWCASCAEEIPGLNALQREYGGLAVLGVNVGESKKKVEKFLKKHPMKYTVLLDEKSEVSQMKYHLYGLPANIVVGRDGVVAYNGAALPEKPKEFIEKLLGD